MSPTRETVLGPCAHRNVHPGRVGATSPKGPITVCLDCRRVVRLVVEAVTDAHDIEAGEKGEGGGVVAIIGKGGPVTEGKGRAAESRKAAVAVAVESPSEAYARVRELAAIDLRTAPIWPSTRHPGGVRAELEEERDYE